MKPLLLDDSDVRRLLSPTEAVSVMESFFRERLREETAGAPRFEIPLQQGRLVFTVGGSGTKLGFRAYLRGGEFELDDQLVVVWDTRNGSLRGLIVGEALGVLRTGAIGGAAVKHMARKNSASMALIGTGRQAFSQLHAIAAICPTLKEVRVYSRTPNHRDEFCEDATELFEGLTIFPVDSAELAVRDADIVVGATTSSQPVIMGEWLKAGAHVTTIGPKGIIQREVDAEVVARADLITTDSPEQAAAFDNGFLTDETDKTVHDLAEVVVGRVKRPSEQAITLFISTGLAGTEVALGARLIQKAYDIDYDPEDTLLLG